MYAHLLILFPFVLLLIMAAAWDIASFTIPNFIPLTLLLAFAVFAPMTGYTAALYETHTIAALLALLAGFALFLPGYIGGGDAKLFAAVAAWFGLHDLLQYALVASIFGGALTLILVAARQWPLPALLESRSWIVRLHEARSGVPYGVALAAGALAILPYTELFRSLSS